MAPSLKLAVGVDIGVSTSGASFILLGPDDRPADPVESIQLRGQDLQPTVIGSLTRKESWGHDIRADLDETKLDLFKLMLAKGVLHHGTLQSARLAVVESSFKRVEQAGLDGVSAMTIYLQRFWKACEEQLGSHLIRIDRSPADLAALHVRFGVPAVWDELTMAQMRTAIEQSNMLSFTGGPHATMAFIPEPEAAAFATIPGLAAKHDVKCGDTVMIADFGGGTVDVISYKLASITPVDVDQCVQSEGALLGDTYMKGALLSYIKQVAHEACDIDIEKLDNTKFQARFENFWRDVCGVPAGLGHRATPNDFLIDGPDDEDVTIPLFRCDLVKELRTVTDDIVSLMKRQVEAVKTKEGSPPTVIVVVGGFGCNRFLQAELRSKFASLKIVFQNQPGEVAVKNGAAIAAAATFDNSEATPPPAENCKYAIRVNSHIPKHSYGFWVGKGPQTDITWVINKGTPVSTDSNKSDIPLNPKAFEVMTDRGCPCVPIYSVAKNTPIVAPRTEGDHSKRLWHVRYRSGGLWGGGIIP